MANNDDASTTSKEDPDFYTAEQYPSSQPIDSDTIDDVVVGETIPSTKNTDKTTEKTNEVTVL